MSRSRKDNERLDRLASEVKKGGGLALPLFFTAILNELLDNGPADDARLAEIVADIGVNKTKKLAETWNGSWEFLTSDLMEQLASKGYAVCDDDGRWIIGENFMPGVRLETIPFRRGLNREDAVTVWEQEERQRRYKASAIDFESASLIRQPRQRHHSPVMMKLLQETYEQYGPINRVVVNAHQQVLDGRHRREIDPDWPAVELKRLDGQPISTDEESLTAMLMLDAINGEVRLTKTERDRINRVLGELPGINSVKRDRVESELRQDAARSNRAIAALVGVSDPTVGSVRAELVCAKVLHKHEFPGSTKIGKHSTDCWCGEGDTAPKTAEKPRQPKAGSGAPKWKNPALLEAIESGATVAELKSRFSISDSTIYAARRYLEGQQTEQAAARQPSVTDDEVPTTIDEPEPDACTCTHCPVHCP